MRDRPRRVTQLVLLAAAFALAWRLELWLIVIAMAAIAIILAAYERIGERALAHRTAACTLYAPHDGEDSNALEGTLAADLAATANAERNILAAAIACAEQTIADPWLRALATERLELAQRLVTDNGLPPPLTVLRRMTTRRIQAAAVTITIVFMLAAIVTRHPLAFLPVTLSVAALGISYGEARRRDALPHVLCEEASTPPPQLGS